MNKTDPFCHRHFGYQRIPTREVMIGDVGIGGENPIRIQSMTTTDTMDTSGTVAQTLRMHRSGCEIVRITAPSKNEAQNLRAIRDELHSQGCKVPLVADIHFTPNAAEIAARIVEKVRVNPGNYADKKKFQTHDYNDATYRAEIERIYERFSPLVKICKEEGTALRIGTNHGSLSDRILSRYGDTPLGMVESAMEFVRICQDHGFHDIVLSMKASNPQVMVQAYRLLMQQMLSDAEVYPLHLGVTEAGEGEDGRIKSALGIGTLLMDGLGDTVRVSLTEEPEYEAPVAQFLVNHFVGQVASGHGLHLQELPMEDWPMDPFHFRRLETRALGNIGGGQVPRVLGSVQADTPEDLCALGYDYQSGTDKYNFSDIAADYIFLGDQEPGFSLPGGLRPVYDARTWAQQEDRGSSSPLFDSPMDFHKSPERHPELNFVMLNTTAVADVIGLGEELSSCVFVLLREGSLPAYAWRSIIYRLHQAGIRQPIFISFKKPNSESHYDDQRLDAEIRVQSDARTQLAMAADASSLLVDGLADGIWLDASDDSMLRAAFGMLQLSRLRITKTEYISCPSCGRTLFDLQQTTASIRKRTEHLKGIKIGIMGCIVNGPGEMADADYGYVGVGPDKISLYRGQEVVKRGIPSDQAVDLLIELIREDSKWVEPETAMN